jgi:L-ascorbate metabolism protein UlaG (beta-lactamase superfamily)
MGPDEALRVFRELGARWLVPMHYGSFKLSFEPIDEPPRLLQSLAHQQRLTSHLRILEEGIPQLF